MTVRTVDAGGATPTRRAPVPWWPVLAVGAAVGAAAALLLPWWRAAAAPVLLPAGPLRELPPDTWAGTEVAGPRAAVVAGLAAVAVAAAVLDVVRRGSPPGTAGTAAAAAGAAAVTCAGATLVGWVPSGEPGAWTALVAGLAAVALALVPIGRSPRAAATAVAAAVLAAGVTVAVPGGAPLRGAATVGPFVAVAPVGPYPLRSGAAGLRGAPEDAWPVVADGAPGIVSGAGVVVADPRGRARVIARTDRGAPAPLGTAGGRMARWAGPDAVAVTGLRADDPLQVVVHDVATSSRVGPDGSLWLHSDLDPPETVRRLDLAARDGTQVLSATYLPVVTIQNPPGEGLVDVNTVLPVAGGALRVADVAGAPQLQRLTETAEGIAATPIAGTADPTCRPSASGAATALAGLVVGGVRTLAADRSGAWFPITAPDGDRLAHLAPDGTLRAVGPPLPGRVAALGDGGDGSLLLIAHGGDGDLLWRLPDPEAALTDLPAPSPACDPAH